MTKKKEVEAILRAWERDGYAVHARTLREYIKKLEDELAQVEDALVAYEDSEWM